MCTNVSLKVIICLQNLAVAAMNLMSHQEEQTKRLHLPIPYEDHSRTVTKIALFVQLNVVCRRKGQKRTNNILFNAINT